MAQLTLLIAVFFIFSVSLIKGNCDLGIVAAGPCDPNSNFEFSTPIVGEPYVFKVILSLKGKLANPFRIKWTVANRVVYYSNINITEGTGYWRWMSLRMPMDGPIPWSVTIDPDNITGDDNPTNNTVSGVFEPVYPSRAVEKYAARTLFGFLENNLQLVTSNGKIGNLSVVFGIPSTHGTQEAINFEPSVEGNYVTTLPHGHRVYEIVRNDVTNGTYTDSVRFQVRCFNMRVNPSILRSVTWEEVDSVSPEWSKWLEPDHFCQSQSPEVQEFVDRSLPFGYRSIMGPYDAARLLHMAVAKELNFGNGVVDAVGVLREKITECGGFCSLLVAALRNIGIPSRRIGGFWQGSSAWHMRVEFHIPGHEWIVADPTSSDKRDTLGNYAYYFGQIDDGNMFVSMSAGDKHSHGFWTLSNIQVAQWPWTNGHLESHSWTCRSYLQPLSKLKLKATENGGINLLISDVPSQGTIAIESSTDLKNWNLIQNIAADEKDKSIDFQKTTQRMFYRSRLLPP
jgi:hypothetical protein